MEMKIANEDEIKLLINMWIEKSVYAENKKMIIWGKNEISREVLSKKYKKPIYCISYEGDVPCAGFILMEKDERYWPEKLSNDAYYLHKFMVCNGFNGKGYSDKVLDLLKIFCKENGKKYLRLDFHAHNEKVKNIYLRNGFEIIEELINFENRGCNMIKAESKII